MQFRTKLTRLVLFSLICCTVAQTAKATATHAVLTYSSEITFTELANASVKMTSFSSVPNVLRPLESRCHGPSKFDIEFRDVMRERGLLTEERPNLPSGTLAEYTLDVFDTSGGSVLSLEPFTKYNLVVSVQDLRENGKGVFSAYVDIEYDPEQISFLGEVDHGADYVNGISPWRFIDETPGELSHVGGLASIYRLGDETKVVASLEFETGDSPDAVAFLTSSPASCIQHPTLLYDTYHETPIDQVRYGSWPVNGASIGQLVPEPELAGNLLLVFGVCLLVGRWKPVRSGK